MKRAPLLLLLFICFSCTNKISSSVVKIDLINNDRYLKITGLDQLIIKEIARDTANNWESLLPVYRMPADTDMKDYQGIQPGTYSLRDNAVIYRPDTPFIKHQTYFMRYYQYGGAGSAWDFIKGKSKPGKVHFIDLIFKP